MRPRKLPCLLMVGLLLLTFPGRAARAGLGDVLKVIGKVLQADQYLWLLGDKGAERRLGGLLARYYLLVNKISRDRQVNAWVNSIFDRLKEAAPRVFRYRIHVVDQPTINAFCLPGGTVFIYRGMLDFADSDDEVAAVLAHEIAHAVHRHSLKRLRRDTAAMMLIKKLMSGHDDQQTLASVAYMFSAMSYSRKNEDQADATGMKIAMDAGFDPSGATSLWEKMQARYGSRHGLQAWLSTHPSHEARVANTRKWLEEHDVEFSRTRSKSYDSRTNQLVNLVPNSSFERGGPEDAFPAEWRIVEGEEEWVRYPGGPGRSGSRALGAKVPFGKSFLLASPPLVATMFHTPRVLAGWFRATKGRPRVYLGVAYLDGEGQEISYHWPGGEMVQVGQEWTLLESVPLDSAEFPEGTERLEVRIYLGRITPGEVWVDDVTLVPGAQLDRRRQPLVDHGDFEFDRDGDGIPDGGYALENGTWETEHSARGFASIRLEGPPVGRGGPRAAHLTTPLFPVTHGATYRVRLLAETDLAPVVARIHWLGHDRARRFLPEGPPPKGFQVPDTWGLVTDEIAVKPPPGTPEVAFVRIRVEADLEPGRRLWIDDLRLEEVEGEAVGAVRSRSGRGRARVPSPTRRAPGERRAPAGRAPAAGRTTPSPEPTEPPPAPPRPYPPGGEEGREQEQQEGTQPFPMRQEEPVRRAPR